LERLAEITVHPATKKEDKPEKIALRCIFKTDTDTYPVNNIIPTISDSGNYGK
jgi:hypothetical protein